VLEIDPKTHMATPILPLVMHSCLRSTIPRIDCAIFLFKIQKCNLSPSLKNDIFELSYFI